MLNREMIDYSSAIQSFFEIFPKTLMAKRRLGITNKSAPFERGMHFKA